MNEQHMDRLLNVAEVLREAHEKEWDFDMGHFGTGQGEASNPDQFKVLKQRGCGTPGCALGHYAVSGLQDVFKLDRQGVLTAEWLGVVDSGKIVPAAKDHFGITSDEYTELFCSEGCNNAHTALEAAQYIENFVAERRY